MRTLPHIAIGCASVWAGTRLLGSTMSSTSHSAGPDVPTDTSQTKAPSTHEAVDFRLVAVGSLLPDMVDRVLRGPMGIRTQSPHQHLLGHTLLLNVPLLIAGLSVLRRQRDPRLASIAAASATHLLVDPVIRSPGTLFWPALGTRFPEARGLSRPLTALTQIAAALAIGAVGLNLWRSGRLQAFLTSGRL
jgi:hypothetical protein